MKKFWLVAALLFAPYAAAQVSSGTAFAVAPGLLVTNQHVVDGCVSVEVLAADGRRAGAVVDADALIDLALIRVTGLKGATARLRSPRNVRLGEAVMVFGFPLSGALSSGGNFTSGLVSALRGFRDSAGEIQITAPVQPGNSGGPVMDASGLVVGVVQAKLDALRSAITTGDIPQNVNFAVSLDVLAEFLAKNKVSVRDAAPAKPLDTASVAELAQSFTYRVECRGKAQQAAAPNVKPPQQVHPAAPPIVNNRWIELAALSADEVRDYMAAQQQRRIGNFNGTITAYQSFLGQYPKSALAHRAQYWIGDSYFNLHDYKNAISSHQKLIAAYPDSASAPDAMLQIASALSQLGETAVARQTLEALVQRYPGSEAADKAKRRILD